VLADLKAALQLTEPGDWQAVYDLSSAYFHIKIFDQHIDYLGASFVAEDGSTQFFRYKYLAFGISTAIHVMTKVMKPLSAYISQLGIRHSIYLDDGRIVAPSKVQAAEDLDTVFSILKAAGWTIASHKSDSVSSVSQIKNYLGFKIDSLQMKVFLQPQKEVAIRSIVREFITFKNKTIRVKFLAKVLGKIISCSPALGQIPLIFARQGYWALEQTVELQGWSAKLVV
jgi:hypothetical protein